MDSNGISRRRVLSTLGAAGAIGLAGCGSTGDSDGGSARLSIGFINDFTGPVAYYGQQAMTGFLSGLAYKNDQASPTAYAEAGEYEVEVGDTTIEIIARDTQFDPSEALNIAQDLERNEGVDILAGVSNSTGARRVINNVVSEAEIPYIVCPAASADLTGSSDTCSDLVYRANENTAMDARSGGRYIVDETDVQNVALFGADYSFGRSVVENYKQVLEAGGINIVIEEYVDQGYSEWEGFFENAEDQGAEGIVGGFTAQTLPSFTTELLTGDYDMQMFGGFASNLTLGLLGDTIVSVLGEDFTAEDLRSQNFGPFTTRYHWNQYDNDINDWFVENHTSAYDIVPDLFTGGAFTAASAVVQAIEQEGEATQDAIPNQMKGMTVADTPKGQDGYQFQEYNNQARSEMTVAEVIPDETDSWPAAIQPSDPVSRVSASETTIPQSDVSCDLS
jgi:branched-chain amino acid transport system substrate-binding protein